MADPFFPPPLPPPLPAETPPLASPPVPRWRWWVHLALIGPYPAIIGLLSLVGPERHAPALGISPAALLFATALELCLFATVFTLAWSASRASVNDLWLRWRRGWWPIVWGAGYSLLLRLALAVIVMTAGAIVVGVGAMSQDELQQFATGNQPDVESLVDVDALRENPVYFWLMLTYVSFIVAGLREELWRAAFLAGVFAIWPRFFATRGARFLAVALGAILFSIGHIPQGALGAVLAGLLGLGLGIIMLVHRSIWPAVLAHGFFNATTFALLPFLADKLPKALG